MECDDRPEVYFRVTRYRRGFVWHFDTEQEARAWWPEHQGHAGAWLMIFL